MANENIKTLYTRIGLRRDSEANYLSSYPQPLKGEILLVDTVSEGVKVKVGDGVNAFKDLNYFDEDSDVITNGYLLNDNFYTDSTYTKILPKIAYKLYINKNNDAGVRSRVYIYDGVNFVPVDKDAVPNATDSIPGIMKLYNTKGDNLDGTMTQKSITDSLNSKFEVSVDEENECAIFSITL